MTRQTPSNGRIGTLLGRLFRRTQPVVALNDAGRLADYIATRAAFVSQRGTTEYCRARTGILWSKLMLEKPFLDALEGCRWIGFAATAADIALLIDGRLRRAAGTEPWQRELVIGCFAEALHHYPEPAVLPGGWQGEIEDLTGRLDLARLAAPKPAQDLGVAAAARIFESLPIHPRLRVHDEELVRNHMRFAMVNVAQELDLALDAAALAPRAPAGVAVTAP